MGVKYLLGMLFISLFLISGCFNQQYICSNGKKVGNPNLCDICGDGKCTGAEESCNCPIDCGPQTGVIKIRPHCSEVAPLFDYNTGACVRATNNCWEN